MLELAALASDGLETGGFLFGYQRSEVGFAVVTAVTGPEPDCKREPYLFSWGPESVRQARERHERGCVFEIGTWHTHCSHPPDPSEGDDEAERWYRSQCGWCDRPDVMAIVSVIPGGRPLGVGVWRYTQEARHQLDVKVADASWRPPIDQDGNWTGPDEGASSDSA